MERGRWVPFAYQLLSGDGTIVARVVSAQNIYAAGVMIRETLTAGSNYASEDYANNGTGNFYFPLFYRASTGGNASSQSGPYYLNLPYWVKLARSGNTFTGYVSPDGVYWTQVGTSVTISMATNVYIGPAVTSGNPGKTLATATFDNVSITAGTPFLTPVITSIAPTSGGISWTGSVPFSDPKI